MTDKQEDNVTSAEEVEAVEVEVLPADTDKKEPEKASAGKEDALSKITIDILIKEVEKYKKLAEENLGRYQYALAELENFKKRVAQERSDTKKYGVIPFAREILHIVDNLERALLHLETADKESLTQGIKMTIFEFGKTLERFGITEVKTVGEQFDPNVHEGLLMVESKDHEPNSVIEEFQKGYVLEDRLLRPAKVSVSLRKGSSETDDDKNK